ncbi:protein tiptop isoform X2 [Culicoides brevitarsis]
MASPRCQSRESSSGGGRCPSDESMHSGRGLPQLPVSPVGLALPPNLPPAAAALLPQHSAAMAAYLVAAQQNQLIAAGLRARAGSPNLLRIPSPLGGDSGILDFSKKARSSDSSENENENDNASDHDDNDSVVNLSGKTEDDPLDLSCSNRKRPSDSVSPPPVRKMMRNDYKPIVSPWTSPVTPTLPYFAQAVAAMSPKQPNHQNEWNGKHSKNQGGTNEAAKALEKMSELSRLGGDEVYRPRETSSSTSGSGPGGRHSAWQSHWLNKGADTAKDVLKCVWCKQSFSSLAALTTHMKETKHCGVSVPPPSDNSRSNAPERSPASAGSSSNVREKETNLNLLIKETMPLPRKLVRGQDVWLGKGAEQTRQILKCMWCGQSFRTLAEMTTHMQQTQHYTNIISQEQIISWKSSDGEKGGGNGGGSGGSGSGSESSAGPNPPVNTSSTVSAVLTCKVCDQAFSSLKELSNHMVKNAHYKEHIMRSITESGGRRRQTREKRKKSLPVRKLLELERAQHDFKNGQVSPGPGKPLGDMSAGRITCEKCNEKIETSVFVDHIRQCVGGVPLTPSQKLKSNLLSNSIIPPDSVSPVPSSGRKSTGDDMSSPGLRQKSPTDMSSNSGKDNKSSSPSVLNAIEQLIEKSFDTRSRHTNTLSNAGSQSTTPLGASILKRLGIDESVDYTKPLMDAQTIGLLRHYQYGTPYRGRERSGSESSSISERGSSRIDSLTPDKKFDTSSHGMTPRATPDKHSERDENSEDEKQHVNVKKEITTDDEDDDLPLKRNKNKENEANDLKIKKENNDDAHDENKRRNSQSVSSPSPSPRLNSSNASVPLSPATSPAISDSHTPRSTPGPVDASSKKNSSSSLGALSSMFDSLTNSNLKANTPSDMSASGTGKKTNAHPLAALQKLCDKTENNRNSTAGGAQSSPLMSTSQSRGGPAGGILAFSWACNDALQGDDAAIKCAYCDTTFNSKGAYRHHLSKVHFMNEESMEQSTKNLVKSEPHSPLSPKNSNNSNASSGNGQASGHRPESKERPNLDEDAKSPSIPPTSTTPSSFQDESPHSKFLKYTELAKQLSSKYV